MTYNKVWFKGEFPDMTSGWYKPKAAKLLGGLGAYLMGINGSDSWG